MEHLEDRIDRLEYYLSMLLKSMDRNKYPFYYLAMSTNLSKQEIEGFLNSCDNLSKRLMLQKEEGLIHFESIYKEFKEAIPSSLSMEDTISTMQRQGMYKLLIKEIKKYI